MIRVGDLTQFQELDGDKIAPFTSDRPRTVRITFNAPQRTVINVIPLDPDGSMPEDRDPLFLAVVEGLEEVEFYAMGSFALACEADRVWFRTVDGAEVAAVVPDAETFTRIHERRVRNPEIEALQHVMQQSFERRMAPMLREAEALRAEREAFHAEREAINTAASAAGGDSPAPEPSAGTGEPARGATPPASGDKGATGGS